VVQTGSQAMHAMHEGLDTTRTASVRVSLLVPMLMPPHATPRPARFGYGLGVVPSGAWHFDRSKSHESSHNPTQRVMAPTQSPQLSISRPSLHLASPRICI
jgi:hypothetical protein